MKITFYILLFITSCVAQNNIDQELKLRQKLADYGIKKEWSESKKIAYKLINEFKGSPERETHYNVLALSISYECTEIQRKNNRTPPDTAQYRGTMTLFLSEPLIADVEDKYSELVDVVNSYFKEFPNGQYEDSFYSHLISAYAVRGLHDKVLEISEKLYNSEKANLKLKAAFHLGRYAHFQQKYESAIEYYKYVLQNLGESEHRVLYNYLVANCYFELNDIDNTNKYLNKVFELTEHNKNNDDRRMAEFMENYLKNSEVKFDRHFVIFKDPANEKKQKDFAFFNLLWISARPPR